MSYPGGVHQPQHRLVHEGRARVVTKTQSAGEGVLAGSRVLEGQISESSFVRIARNRRALWTGRIRQLRCAGSAGPAGPGQECLIAFDGFQAFEPGDSVEAFQLASTK